MYCQRTILLTISKFLGLIEPIVHADLGYSRQSRRRCTLVNCLSKVIKFGGKVRIVAVDRWTPSNGTEIIESKIRVRDWVFALEVS